MDPIQIKQIDGSQNDISMQLLEQSSSKN